MNKNAKRILTAGTLAVAANMAFLNDGHDDTAASIDWNSIIKSPTVIEKEPDKPLIIGKRVTASPAEFEFNASGLIQYNGQDHCTGTVVNIEGYHAPSEGFYVSTAAHCLYHNKNTQRITFLLNFENKDGDLEYASYVNPMIWYNPKFTSTHHAYDSENDQALMFFPNQTTPDDVVPAALHVYSRQIMRDFGAFELQNLAVTAAGYSDDMTGLSKDDQCHILSVYRDYHYPFITTDCSLNHGASGSGLITSAPDDDAKPVSIGGVTSSISSNYQTDDPQFRSNFNLVYHQILAQVPFIEKDDACARVTAPNGLKVRTENYHEQGSAYMTLPFNDVVYVTDMLEDEQEKYGADDVWLEVRTLDNPDKQTPNGFSNAAWLQQTPCPPKF